MLRTRLLDLLVIEHPIIQAGMGPFGSGVDLAAAVSNAGAIGSISGTKRSLEALRAELRALRERTDRPFIVNFTQPWLLQHPECLDEALAARPRAISLSYGEARGLVARAHDAGILFIQQVHTVGQASEAAEAGADLIIAQGTEAGGFTGRVASAVLVPQVVDAVAPLPVVAAGGIADGRGLAAALVLGAVGANIGTRFLASVEAAARDEVKRQIVNARAEDAVRIEAWQAIVARPGDGAFDVAPRALSTPFIERMERSATNRGGEAEAVRASLAAALDQGHMDAIVPFAGQSAGAVDSVEPAATIVACLVRDAEEALRRAQAFLA